MLRRILKSQAGITLVELTAVMMAMGVIAVATLDVMVYFNLRTNKSKWKLEGMADEGVGDRFLFYHLRVAGHTFNRIMPEYAGGSGLPNFFDYNPDYPNALRPVADRPRNIVMRAGGTNSMVLVTGRPVDGTPLAIDPVKAYDSTPANNSTSGLLLFQGINRLGYFQAIAPKMYQNGKLLYFYLPNQVRPVTMSDDSYSTPYCFFGKVQGDQIVKHTPLGTKNCVNPMDGSDIPSLDVFFRNVPSFGGSIPVVLVQSVDVIKYSIKDNPTNGRKDFVFEKWNGAEYTNSVTIVPNVETVSFHRESTSDSSISYDIQTKDQ